MFKNHCFRKEQLCKGEIIIAYRFPEHFSICDWSETQIVTPKMILLVDSMLLLYIMLVMKVKKKTQQQCFDSATVFTLQPTNGLLIAGSAYF